jgi:large conductance mechanosensitive channel
MFLLIKGINRMKRKAEAAPAKPTKDQELLTEIRDLLKDRAAGRTN